MDLSGIVQQAIRDRTADVERHQLRVKAAVRPAWVIGDPTLIARLVANLCDNAVHYNTLGGVIDISTRLDTGRAVLVIANTGPVVPPDEVHRLFEPFQRLHRVSDDAHHGLGLSIVRAIVAAYSAELNAYARPGGGLAVEIAFPAAEANPRPAG
ncbi:ATP-binding protein [Streptomyces sp. NPDC000410]|uniref:sensor histidine kinase n=1 Tax=Streptomyces sp. NPDC000410 TaxID=3154254 RepID=UPI00331B3D28